jgi:hypothetical protein
VSINSAAVGTPIPAAVASFQFVNPETGTLTDHGAQVLNAWHKQHVGMGRIFPCDASGTNVITLTPVNELMLLEKYSVYDVFVFRAANSASGVVTATVVPKTGALATLKVYASDGAAQATTGDVVADSVYMLIYAPHLDTAAGGLVVLK